ncbi:hypothetical protein ABKN59_011076 [Abortiporus biennis]
MDSDTTCNLDSTCINSTIAAADLEIPQRDPVTLPIEIWESIIDLVAYESLKYIPSSKERHRTLQACASTCRSWRYRSLYHLNSVVNFYDSSSVSRFLSRFPPPHNPANTVSIITSEDNNPYWASSVPIRISSVMPQLHEVAIRDFDFNNAHPQFIPTLSLARSVEELSLIGVTFASASQCRRVICAFRQLNWLRLERVDFPVIDVPTQVSRLRAPVVRKPYITYIGLYSYGRRRTSLPFLIDLFQPFVKTVEWLEIDEYWLSDHCVDSSRAFIQACKRLEIFELIPEVTYEYLDNLGSLDLSKNRRLKTLRMISEQEDGFIPFVSLFAQLLRTIRSPKFHSIHLRIPLGSVQSLSTIDWKSLDRVLGSKRFQTLEQICIVVQTFDGVFTYKLKVVLQQQFFFSELPPTSPPFNRHLHALFTAKDSCRNEYIYR